MGNPLLKQYSVGKEEEPLIDGSRFLRWKVYRGFDKDRAFLSTSSSSASSVLSSSSSALRPGGGGGGSAAAAAGRSSGGGTGGGGGAAAAAASICSAVAAASFSSSAAFTSSGSSSGFAAAAGCGAAPAAAAAVSLFCFDKKLLLEPPFAQSAPLRAELLRLLHREALLLQRLRHPKLLHLLEPLQEDKHSLVFCTRFVHATLKQQLLRDAAASSASAAAPTCPSASAAACAPHNGASPYSNGAAERRRAAAAEDGSRCSSRWSGLPLRAAVEEHSGALSLLEIKAGLLDILEALQFLHADAQLVHLNIHFESIFLTSSGHWRLGGLAFAAELTGSDKKQTSAAPVSFTPFPDSLHSPVALGPPLYYSAPEAAQQQCCTAAADIFSLGLLMAELFAGRAAAAGTFKGRLVQCGEWDVQTHRAECDRLVPLAPELFHASPYFQGAAAAAAAASAAAPVSSAAAVSSANAISPEAGNAAAAGAPPAGYSSSSSSSSLSALLTLLNGMLQPDPRARPTVEQCMQAPFFQDLNVRALRFLESLHEKDEQQKIQFLKGFLPLLQQQQELRRVSLLRDRILKPLLDALVHPPLYPYVLPGLFFVLKTLDDRAYFQRQVWPSVRPLLTAREIQVESVLLLVNELEFLMDMGTPEANQQDLLPLLAKCMQIPEIRIQEAVLERLSRVHSKFEYTVLRTVVLPRVLSLIQQATVTSTRVEGLKALAAMAGSFDRSTIINQVAPVVQQVTEADRSSAACLAVSDTVKALSEHVGLRLTVERLLRILLPLLMEEDLTASTFYEINETVSFFLRKVLATREKQFAIKSEQASAVAAVLPPTVVSSTGCADGVHTPRKGGGGGGEPGDTVARSVAGLLSPSRDFSMKAADAATSVCKTEAPLEALLLTSFSLTGTAASPLGAAAEAAAAAGTTRVAAGGGRGVGRAGEEAVGRSRHRGDEKVLPAPPPPPVSGGHSGSSNGAVGAAAAGAAAAAHVSPFAAAAPPPPAAAGSSSSSAPAATAAADDLLMSLAAAAAQLSAPGGASSGLTQQQQQSTSCIFEAVPSTDPWLGVGAAAAPTRPPSVSAAAGEGGAAAAWNAGTLQGSLSPLRAPPPAHATPAAAAGSNSFSPPSGAGTAAAPVPPPAPRQAAATTPLASSLSSDSSRRPTAAGGSLEWAATAVSPAVERNTFLSPLPVPAHPLFPPTLPRQPHHSAAAAAAPLTGSKLSHPLQQQQQVRAAAAATAAVDRNGSPACTTQSSSRANSCKNTYSLQDIFAACVPTLPSGPSPAAAAAAPSSSPPAAAAAGAPPAAAASGLPFSAWPASGNVASSSLAATPQPPPLPGTFSSQLLPLSAGPAGVSTGRSNDDPFAGLLPPTSAAPHFLPAGGGSSPLPGSATAAVAAGGCTDKRAQSSRNPFEKLGDGAAAEFSRSAHAGRPNTSVQATAAAAWPPLTAASQQNHQQHAVGHGVDPFSNLDSLKL